MRTPAAPSVAAALALFACRLARAQVAPPPPTDVAQPLPSPASGVEAITPPVLRGRAEATYPPDALRAGIEATVGLELVVDEQGRVASVRVTAPAGHGLDEAALEAVRRFTFEPARRNGVAIRSSVQLGYEFRLPSPPRSAHTAVAPAPPAPLTVSPPEGPARSKRADPNENEGPARSKRTDPNENDGPAASTLIVARRPLSTASAFSVQDRDFALRPVGSVQDILRVTPGLVTVQHSGGGKANQYFLRGFDADHGTDLSLNIDGIPINMPSHAHGQGFADTNFIIPETVERVEITKGPYFADQGDFATAGHVNLVTRDDFEHSSVGLGFGGSPGHGAPEYRGLLIASPRLAGSIRAVFAAELGQQNGPFDNPEGYNKYKLFNKVTVRLTPGSRLTVGESSYASEWHGSGQIPARAVEQGLVSRFGSIDPNEGGDTARHHVFASYTLHPADASTFEALVYLGTYRFDLFSNFTLYLDDPDNGDEIEQIDRRTFYGGQTRYRVIHTLGGVRFDTTLGAQARSDDIHEELWHTRARVQLSQTRGDDVHESLVGAFVDEEVTPVTWLRIDAALRSDFLGFSVNNRLADPGQPPSGIGSGQQLSPKATAVVTALDRPEAQLEAYANFGEGYHTNDVRGAFASPPVTPIARAVGEEVGARSRFWGRWDLAVALWRLTLDSETTWDGDNGTTSVSDPTLRYGVELGSRFEITQWLAADADITFTHSQFSTDRENGGGLALAPKQTWSGGLSARHALGPGVARGGLRFYGIGDRPASDDGVIVAPGFTQIDLHLGYRHRRFDVALDVLNLLDGDFRSAQFDTISRLRTDPPIGASLNRLPPGFSCGSRGRMITAQGGGFGGCEGVDFTPAFPLTIRAMASLFLD
jgi:TonB family protein